MTTIFTLSFKASGAQAVAAEALPIMLLLLLLILAGPLLMPVIATAVRVTWRLLVLAARAALRYAIDKAIDAIVWGAVAIIGAMLFWG